MTEWERRKNERASAAVPTPDVTLLGFPVHVWKPASPFGPFGRSDRLEMTARWLKGGLFV